MKNYNSKIRTSGAENLCLAGSDSVAAAVGPVCLPSLNRLKKLLLQILPDWQVWRRKRWRNY